MLPTSTKITVPLLLILFAACQPLGPTATDHRTGSDGIVLSFSQGTPDEEVYEQSTIPVFVQLANRGAWDVRLEEIFFKVSGDEYYVSVETYPEDEIGAEEEPEGIQNPNAQGPDPFEDYLNGKSDAYPNGEIYETRSFVSFKRVPGLRQKPETQLYARICYPYATMFSADICVDLNSFNQNVQGQACEAADQSFTDQGAPVAVTAVENRPVPRRVSDDAGNTYQGVMQVFNVRIENVGSGAVLRPVHETLTHDGVNTLGETNISAEERVAACNQDIPTELLNTVGVSADLSGSPLDCVPDVVQLRGGRGFTRCILPEEESLSMTGPNYIGILNVQLDYLYTASIATDVQILRQPFETGTAPDPSTNPALVGEGPGAVPRCDFCSANRNAAECDGWTGSTDSTVQYSCACSQEECFARSADDACIYGRTWCPGANYCCPTLL